MSKEKKEEKYLVCIINKFYFVTGDDTRERAIEIARLLKSSLKQNKDNNPRIFKIEEEVDWQKEIIEAEQEEQEKQEKDLTIQRFDCYD